MNRDVLQSTTQCETAGRDRVVLDKRTLNARSLILCSTATTREKFPLVSKMPMECVSKLDRALSRPRRGVEIHHYFGFNHRYSPCDRRRASRVRARSAPSPGRCLQFCPPSDTP